MGGADMSDGTWVGLDVHARSVVAGLIDEASGECRTVSAPAVIEELVGWLSGLPAPVRVAYEAGPTGYGLARALEVAKIGCLVCAPSLIARAPGERVKNDRTDAERLARLLRRGELTAVRVPTAGEEALRDLCRARDDARADLMRARHRLSKFLLRHGRIYPKGKAWTTPHAEWVRIQRFAEPASEEAFRHYWAQVLQSTERRQRLDEQIAEAATGPELAAIVGRLCALRGVGAITAVGLCSEVGDWRRFSGRSIGSWVGLTPTEAQSGERRARGPISRRGSRHARWLLVESAWHHRRPLRPSRDLIRRRETQRAEVIQRAERAERRLHRRWRHLEGRRGMRATIVAAAIARELAGHLWSLAVMDD
jgi:transposase